jgi:hypothetical protein
VEEFILEVVREVSMHDGYPGCLRLNRDSARFPILIPLRITSRSRGKDTWMHVTLSEKSSPSMGAARTVVVGIAMATAAAGGAHGILAPGHGREDALLGLGFLIVGLVQIVVAAFLVFRPSRDTVAGIALVNAAVLLVYACSRMVGLPIGATPWLPEPIGPTDALVATLEASTVAAALLINTRWWRYRRGSRTTIARGKVAVWAVAGASVATLNAAGTAATHLDQGASPHEAHHLGHALILGVLVGALGATRYIMGRLKPVIGDLDPRGHRTG